MLPKWIRGACCIQRWGVRCPEGMKRTPARHLWVLSPIGACLGHVASTENLALWACWYLLYPSMVILWRDAATHVKSVGCVWIHSCHLDPCAFPFRCKHYSEILKTLHTGVFAPLLILWVWHCSIFSHHCSTDITKKLMQWRLGLILFKPWVLPVGLLTVLGRRRIITRITPWYEATVLDQWVRKLFLSSHPPLVLP